MNSPESPASITNDLSRGVGVLVRLSVAAAAICLSLLGLSMADDVHASIKKQINIPAQGLGPALQLLAKDRDFQVVYRTEVVGNLRTEGAVGEFTPEEALKKLLSGTGLTYRYLDDKTVTIFPTATGGGSSSLVSPSTESSANPDPPQIHLAQVNQSGPPSSQTTEQGPNIPKGTKRESSGLEEIIVTGTRIPGPRDQQIQPVRSYTREEIQQSGQTTVANFLNTLPDVSVQSFDNPFSSFLGQTTVQLHGLPVGTTLVLLNGRRVEEGTSGFLDLSNIPVSAVQRIDVLPVGASAIYGSDALGGAVNIILRTDMTGLEVNTRIARAADTTEKDVDFAIGKGWERGAVSFLGNYQNQSELLGYDRAVTSGIAGIPTAMVPLLVGDYCFPGNVYSLNGQSLPGLSSPEAGIPAGIQGPPTIQQFVGTAGKLNLCNINRYTDLVPATTRVGGLLSAHYQVTDSVDLFTEVLASHESQTIREGNLIDASYDLEGSTLAANNPYNPFGETVGVSYTYPGIGVAYQHTEDFLRPLIGIRGSIFSDWKYEVTTLISRDRSDSSYPTTVNATTGVNSIQTALSSSNPATALNPFSNGAPGSPQLLQSLVQGFQDTSYVNQATDGLAVFNGPLGRLPAGPIQTAFGGEFEREKQYTFLSVVGGLAAAPPLNLSRDSYAVFAESRIPIFAGSGQLENGERLAATVAGRYDHSSDFGGKATWQGGAVWRPTETVSVRGGYGTSYRAPHLQEISGGTLYSYQDTVDIDPFRGKQPVSAPVIIASNPKLKPETGESMTVGTTYSSQSVPGFVASATYFTVDITNYIGVPSTQVIVDYPSLFPGGVERAPPTAQDVQNGYLGAITQINDLYFNYGNIDVAGIDADIRYAFETSIGKFTPSIALADLVKWRAALTPGLPEVSYLSQATLIGPGFAPRWKGTVALNWKVRALSANVAGRYLGPYKDYQDLVPNANVLGNYWLWDVNARYDFGANLDGRSWASGAYVAVGAINVFNKPPQFAHTGAGFDYAEADVRERIVYLNVGLKW